MNPRVRTAGLALGVATLLMPLAGAQALPAAAHSITITDPTAAAGDPSWAATRDSDGQDVAPPAPSTVLDLAKVSVAADPTRRTITFDFVAAAPITSTTCVRSGGRTCSVYFAARGVNPSTGANDQYSYELFFQPLLGASAQHPRVESMVTSFTRDLTVTGVSTFGQHFVVTLSTANVPDARLRPFLTIDSAHGSTIGAVGAVRSYFLNAAHDTATFVDLNGQTSLPDIALR